MMNSKKNLRKTFNFFLFGLVFVKSVDKQAHDMYTLKMVLLVQLPVKSQLKNQKMGDGGKQVFNIIIKKEQATILKKLLSIQHPSSCVFTNHSGYVLSHSYLAKSRTKSMRKLHLKLQRRSWRLYEDFLFKSKETKTLTSVTNNQFN